MMVTDCRGSLIFYFKEFCHQLDKVRGRTSPDSTVQKILLKHDQFG